MTPDAVAAAPEITMLGLLLKADLVVKLTLLVLVLASLVSWAIILDQSIRLGQARREAAAFARTLRQQGAVQAWIALVRAAPATQGPRALVPLVVGAGLSEWMEGEGDGAARGAEAFGERRDRTERAMRLALGEQLRALEARLPFLATVGSTAPFVGLFGTVWGIMNSFLAIAHSNDTSLAVVAPGIAEALFATAIGLLAAIPAVVAYNKLGDMQRRLGQDMTIAVGRAAMRLARHAQPMPAPSAQAASPQSAAAE